MKNIIFVSSTKRVCYLKRRRLYSSPKQIYIDNLSMVELSSSHIIYIYIYIYIYIGWNDRIVAQEKTTWFHFRLMKTGFLSFFFFFFFFVDHLLVRQLCTNPKSDRSLLSRLKVTQCSTSEIGDAPLYNSWSLPIQVMTTGPLPAPSKCKSGRFNPWGHSSKHRTILWRWWSGRTPPGRPVPRSSSKRSSQSLMKLPSGLFGRLPEI